MLNLSTQFQKFCITAMFLIVELQVFLYAGMLVVILCNRFHILGSKNSIVTPSNQNTKKKFHNHSIVLHPKHDIFLQYVLYYVALGMYSKL